MDAVEVANCSALTAFTLTTIGRDASVGSMGTWERVAPPPSGSITTVELKTQLNTWFEQAGTFEGVPEFAVK